jgi:peptide/nickel transport system ATP-binding protein
MSNNFLEIENLRIKFDHNSAVNSISFQIEEGKTVGIVGESGSGKSVTSLAIMGLLPENESTLTGTIKFKGENLPFHSREEMREYRKNHFAMIFQEPMTSLNPVMKCGLQVTEAIINKTNCTKKEAKEQCLALFKEVELPTPDELFNRYPHELSGGQKQRVMIAMALSTNPELLIADEPTTALDVTVQKSILQLLKRIQKERSMTVLFISHDLGVINQIASDVIVMYKGDIVETGQTSEVLNKPKHQYTKGLISCRPLTTRKLLRLPTLEEFLSKKDDKSVKLQEKTAQFTEKRVKTLITGPKLFEIDQLNVEYVTKTNLFGHPKQHFNAVNNVSFDIFKGEVLGVVGESGSGKTSLGRAILRLISSNSDKLLFEGKSLLDYQESQLKWFRKKAQIIFQDPYSSLNPRQTIGQSILEPYMVHNPSKSKKEAKTLALTLLEKVGLTEEQFTRFPHEFSGGQRQRIGIARALAVEPEFIVCDESVSALDVSIQAQILNLLADLQEEHNLTYLFISHDLSVVKHFCDRIIVLNQGKIEEIGLSEDLFTKPTSNYTKKLISSIPQDGITV